MGSPFFFCPVFTFFHVGMPETVCCYLVCPLVCCFFQPLAIGGKDYSFCPCPADGYKVGVAVAPVLYGDDGVHGSPLQLVYGLGIGIVP